MVEMGEPDSYTPRPSQTGLGRVMRSVLPPDYRPSDDEEFMNPRQVEYFRQMLLRWRADLFADSSGTLRHLKKRAC